MMIGRIPPGPRHQRGDELAPLRLCGALTVLGICLALSGCTTFRQYVDNGFKVGPNYRRPPVPVAPQWIDAADPRVQSRADDDSQWWTAFHDPVLDNLVQCAYRQNLSLREAAFRVLQARFEFFIAVGNFFPQTQQAFADYLRQGFSTTVANRSFVSQRWFNIEDLGFNLQWEIDFWGQYRRSIASTEDGYQASIEDYDAILVTLIGDIGQYYTQLRVAQSQLAYMKANVVLQRKTLDLVNIRFKDGAVSNLDVQQAQLNLSQTEAQIPPLEIAVRQANNRLCVLLGTPPKDLSAMVGEAPVPSSAPDVAVGMPADLIRRRPELRKLERLVAAQNEQIGIAMAQLYPHMGIGGQIGYQTSKLANLFNDQSIFGQWGPFLQWNVLNYGRLWNQVRVEEAKYQELVLNYQNRTLKAGEEVENGLVQFLQSQAQLKAQTEATAAASKSVDLVMIQYREGTADFNRVYLLERQLVDQQFLLAQAQGNIAQGLVQIYRALGGGWQIRCQQGDAATAAATPPAEAEALPAAPKLPVADPAKKE